MRLKLKGRIVELFGSISGFAKAYGISAQTVRNVIKGEYTPTGMSRIGWMAALNIPEDEADIFFS